MRPVRPHGAVSRGIRPGRARSRPVPWAPCVWQAVPAAHANGRTCQRTTLLHSDAPRRRTTCPRGPSRGTLLRRLRGFPGFNRLGRACSRRVVHAYRTAKGGELCESRRDARATMARCREEWPYGAHSESLREACGSGRRCPPRPPPGKPSTIRCSPDLVLSVGPSGAALRSR